MMSPPETSNIRVVVVERSPERWAYKHDGEYIEALKNGAGLVIEVGSLEISEEPAHTVRLPGPVLASFLEWVRA